MMATQKSSEPFAFAGLTILVSQTNIFALKIPNGSWRDCSNDVLACLKKTHLNASSLVAWASLENEKDCLRQRDDSRQKREIASKHSAYLYDRLALYFDESTSRDEYRICGHVLFKNAPTRSHVPRNSRKTTSLSTHLCGNDVCMRVPTPYSQRC